MPRFDGTGPRGTGAMSGRGEGYCAIAYPEDRRPYGYAGVQGKFVSGFSLLRCLNPFRTFGRGFRGGGQGQRTRW